MPLTSLSDSFLTLPLVALHPWSHAHLFLPSPWSVLVASAPGLFPPTFFSSKYVAVCSQMPRRRKPPTPSPSVLPNSYPPPFHNPIQVFNSKCRFSKKHFTVEGWGPQDEYLPPPPPSADLASFPGQLDPSTPSTPAHRGYLCPQCLLNSQPSSCLSGLQVLQQQAFTTAWLAPLLP